MSNIWYLRFHFVGSHVTKKVSLQYVIHSQQLAAPSNKHTQ